MRPDEDQDQDQGRLVPVWPVIIGWVLFLASVAVLARPGGWSDPLNGLDLLAAVMALFGLTLAGPGVDR